MLKKLTFLCVGFLKLIYRYQCMIFKGSYVTCHISLIIFRKKSVESDKSEAASKETDMNSLMKNYMEMVE